MIWVRRGVTLLAILAMSYVIWWLVVHYDGADASLVAIISIVGNGVIYFMGRADKYEEQIDGTKDNTTLHQ